VQIASSHLYCSLSKKISMNISFWYKDTNFGAENFLLCRNLETKLSEIIKCSRLSKNCNFLPPHNFVDPARTPLWLWVSACKSQGIRTLDVLYSACVRTLGVLGGEWRRGARDVALRLVALTTDWSGVSPMLGCGSLKTCRLEAMEPYYVAVYREQ